MEFSARMYEQGWAFVEQGLPVDLASRQASLLGCCVAHPAVISSHKHRRADRHDQNQRTRASRAAQWRPVAVTRVEQI